MFSDLKACVKMYTRSVGYWMDASCGEYRPYVCKRRMGEEKTCYALRSTAVSSLRYHLFLGSVYACLTQIMFKVYKVNTRNPSKGQLIAIQATSSRHFQSQRRN